MLPSLTSTALLFSSQYTFPKVQPHLDLGRNAARGSWRVHASSSTLRRLDRQGRRSRYCESISSMSGCAGTSICIAAALQRPLVCEVAMLMDFLLRTSRFCRNAAWHVSGRWRPLSSRRGRRARRWRHYRSISRCIIPTRRAGKSSSTCI